MKLPSYCTRNTTSGTVDPPTPTMRLMTHKYISLISRFCYALACTLLFLCASVHAQLVEVGDGGPGPVKAQHLTAELTTLGPQIAAGGHLQAGLVLTIEEHWHVYWINAGDSGEPPKIKWTLPDGITAGPMRFPPPQRLPLGPLMDYGYEDQVAFPVELTAASSAKPGKVHLDAHVTWLVCAEVCLPGKAHLGIDVDVVSGSVPDPPVVGALGQGINSIPKPLPPGMELTATGGAKQILLNLKTGTREEKVEFYPYDSEQIENATEQTVQPQTDGARIWLQRATDATTLPQTLHGLIELGGANNYEFTAKITPGEVPPAPAETSASGKKSAEGLTLISALTLAFFGGIILNLMPCVFPVLFLKGLALVNSSGEEQRRQRLHGIVYAIGIIVSFWAVVAVLLALRAGGRQLGWGFQLQSPGFVAILAAFLFFLGLSLAGQFELGLSLTSAGGELAKKQGFAGSFFTGVLATVVATPCMGPFMGAAVGFALAQPSWLTFLVFTTLALGLALPYLLLTLNPRWTRILPRPGAWMEVLKQVTAVPLFATAIWLVWVYARLHGNDGVDRMVALLVCFLVLAIAGWVLGRWPARWASGIVAALLIAFGIMLPLLRVRVGRTQWQPYTAASFQAARASGKPVFIDFTAAWCLSCQVNERAVLHSAEVESTFITKDFVLLKADWTQYDPAITQELASVGRSGVPTYVIYPAGDKSNADVLPELLTKDVVLKAIQADTARDAGSH